MTPQPRRSSFQQGERAVVGNLSPAPSRLSVSPHFHFELGGALPLDVKVDCVLQLVQDVPSRALRWCGEKVKAPKGAGAHDRNTSP